MALDILFLSIIFISHKKELNSNVLIKISFKILRNKYKIEIRNDYFIVNLFLKFYILNRYCRL
jgi:hypothetical protein